MINILIGMTIMYFVCSINLIIVNEGFDNSYCSDWVMWVFCWYIILIRLVIKKIKKIIDKNKKR